MKIRGPIVTLIVGVIIAAIVLILDINAKPAPVKTPSTYGMVHISRMLVGGVRG